MLKSNNTFEIKSVVSFSELSFRTASIYSIRTAMSLRKNKVKYVIFIFLHNSFTFSSNLYPSSKNIYQVQRVSQNISYVLDIKTIGTIKVPK